MRRGSTAPCPASPRRPAGCGTARPIPVVTFAADGTAYLSVLEISLNCPSAVTVLVSHDGGATWSRPHYAHRSNVCTLLGRQELDRRRQLAEQPALRPRLPVLDAVPVHPRRRVHLRRRRPFAGRTTRPARGARRPTSTARSRLAELAADGHGERRDRRHVLRLRTRRRFPTSPGRSARATRADHDLSRPIYARARRRPHLVARDRGREQRRRLLTERAVLPVRGRHRPGHAAHVRRVPRRRRQHRSDLRVLVRRRPAVVVARAGDAG